MGWYQRLLGCLILNEREALKVMGMREEERGKKGGETRNLMAR
jgi:hypothetical protein